MIISFGHKVSIAMGMLLMSTALTSAEPNRGMQVYEDYCASCHGMDLGGYIAPGVNSTRYDGVEGADLVDLISDGVEDTLMPGWGKKLSKEDILAVADYIVKTPVRDIEWTMDDIRKSVKVYVQDESKLPNAPTYAIGSMRDIMAVTARGTYARDGSKVVFFNGANNEQIAELPVDRAPHIVNYDPSNERWAYLKTDGGRIYKIDLYTMQAVRSVQVGFTGPSLAVTFDGKYVVAGSFVPNTAVLLDAKTLEPLKYFKLEGIDPDGKQVEGDSGSITATHFGPYVSISLEQTGQVWIVDTSTPNFETTKIKNVGRHLHDSFLSEDGRYMYIAAYDDNKLSVIDFKTKSMVGAIATGCQPHTGSGAIFKNKAGRNIGVGTNIGAHCDDDRFVTLFDADSFEVIKQLKVSGKTESPAAHPNAPYVIVDIVEGDDMDKLALIDKETLSVSKLLEVGGHAYFPEYTANGKFIYASAGYDGNKLVIFDSTSLEKVKEVDMESPAGIFSHDRPRWGTVGLAPRKLAAN